MPGRRAKPVSALDGEWVAPIMAAIRNPGKVQVIMSWQEKVWEVKCKNKIYWLKKGVEKYGEGGITGLEEIVREGRLRFSVANNQATVVVVPKNDLMDRLRKAAGI